MGGRRGDWVLEPGAWEDERLLMLPPIMSLLGWRGEVGGWGLGSLSLSLPLWAAGGGVLDRSTLVCFLRPSLITSFKNMKREREGKDIRGPIPKLAAHPPTPHPTEGV